MAYFIHSREKAGLSKEVAVCLLKSLEISTLCAYLRSWKKFAHWLNSRNISDSQISIEIICDYLNKLFKEDYTTSALNVTRSAISFFLNHKIDVGSNVLINKLFKYFWKARPFPRYLVTGSIEKLLSFLQTWHPPSVLTLEELTMKTIALTAVFSSDRAQTLESIDINHSHVTDEGILFPIYSLLKTSKKNAPVTVVKCTKSKDPSLNVCDYIVSYLNRTFPYRVKTVAKGHPKPRHLFLSAYTKKPMRRTTIANIY